MQGNMEEQKIPFEYNGLFPLELEDDDIPSQNELHEITEEIADKDGDSESNDNEIDYCKYFVNDPNENGLNEDLMMINDMYVFNY